MVHFRRKAGVLSAVIALATGSLVACGSDSSSVKSAELPEQPAVVSDGLNATATLLKSSETAVVSSPGVENRRRAAAIAVAAGAPMMVAEADSLGDVEKELDRLGVTSVFSVGQVDLGATDKRKIIADPGTAEGLKKALDTDFGHVDAVEQDAAKVIAEMDSAKPSVTDVDDAGPSRAEMDKANKGSDDSDAKSTSFPKSKPKAQKKITALAAPGTPLASIATARAAGIPVKYISAPDPRADGGSIEAARNAANGNEKLIALGDVFGSTDKFTQALKLAQGKETEQLPGGGTLLFPGRHIVATYGHPGAAPLGVMGEDEPKEAVKRAQDYVSKYQDLTGDKVIPGFEIIASVAQGAPGPRGDFSEPAPAETLLPYIDEMTKAGGYVILDLQPGSADFLDQAKVYEDLLKRPNVGLALDAEWKMEPGQIPATEVGHVNAEEVNRVSEWLAKLTRDSNLPQKMLMLHQFQLQMIRDREKLDVSHPELSFVLHADGHGSAQEKFETWDVIRKELQPEIFPAWKNFIDEDQPMFTPQQTMNIEPRPWVVTYQ